MAKKILIVEDHLPTVEMMTEMFKMEEFEVASASDGLEGLKKAESEKPDLIVLDVMMPYMDGIEVCKKLKESSKTSKIPVIIVSVKAAEADINTGKGSGANDYVVKPFDPQKLMEAVHKLIK